MARPDTDSHVDQLRSFFADPTTCQDSFQLLVSLAIRVAAIAGSRTVLEIVENSPKATLFAPLAGGLRIQLGQPADEVGQAFELAQHIAQEIDREIIESGGGHDAVA